MSVITEPNPLIAELDKLITLLEAEIPANPNSPKNQKLQKRLEGELVKYFNKVEKAFPYSSLDKIYNKHVIKEQLGSETRGMLDSLLATFSKNLEVEMAGQLAEIYISGQAEIITWGKTKGGIPIAYEGPPVRQAIDWANSHVIKAKLVDGINEETRKQLSQVIADGIKNKRGIPGIKSDIRHKLNWMARGAPSDIKGLTLASRAELIAKTETRQALFTASHDNMIEMGIDGKEWILGAGGAEGNCEDCQANASAGVIPVNEDFPNPEGDIHPGCTCAIAPARLPKK